MRILDILEQNNAVATFFDVGSCVDEYPEVTKREADIGCEVASHTYRHINIGQSTAERLENDKKAADAAFTNAIGYVPALIRPPEGSVTYSTMALYDQIFIGWSVDTLDWVSHDASSICYKVQTAGNLDGQVVLMHSIYQPTAEATEFLVPWLIEQGYQLVTVSELLEYCYGLEEPEQHYYYAYDYFVKGRPAPVEEAAAEG